MHETRGLKGMRKGTALSCPARHIGARHRLWSVNADPEYPVTEEDRLGHSAAVPVHLSGVIRRTVRQLFG